MLRRLALTVPALLAAALVAGCGAAPPPEVTFAAGPASAVARPTQYCDDSFVDCTNDAAAPVELAVAPGTALQVSVPESVSTAPWQIVFSYRTAAGESIDGRTGVFTPGTQQTYALELPSTDDRLVTAQVQQFGPPPERDPNTGDINFSIRGSWVLTVSA